MYRTLVGIAVSLLIALSLVSLTFSASVDEPAEFRFVNGTEPKTLDPDLATGQPEGRIMSAIFEGLTRRDAKTLEPVPGVAESWTTSSDGLRYTFSLRKTARWTDGRPVTAQDFVYSWKRLLDPKMGAEYAYILHMVRHAEAYNTYAEHAANLLNTVRPAVEKLMAAAQPDVEAKRLTRALSMTHAYSALHNSRSEKLTQLIDKKHGKVGRSELRWLVQRLETEAKRLRSELFHAREHFGKDEGIFAPDSHTFVVELRAPTPYFLELTAFYPALPVPRWAVNKVGASQDWFLPERIVSNGPFTLARWTVNDRIRLMRSETYWDKAHVRAKSIEALPVENPTTALNLYLTGEIHWLPSLYPLELVHRFRKRSDFYVGPSMVVYYYRFNCDRGPLRDRRVRQAISLAVDRELIVKEVLGRGEIPAYNIVPPGLPGYEPPESKLRYDPARGRQLLADAGYAEGKGLPELGILYNTLESHKMIAEVIADQLRKNLGIRVSAYNQEWQSYLETVRLGDYDIARAGWIGDYLDPNTFLDNWVTNGGNNQTGFSSPDYDALIRAAGNVGAVLDDPGPVFRAVRHRQAIETLVKAAQVAETAELKFKALGRLRMALLREAEGILFQEEFPVMPIYFYVQSGFISPKVSGFYSKLELPDGSTVPNLQDLHPLYAISVGD